jgi:cytochrome c oxidase cbb3-type subunit 4
VSIGEIQAYGYFFLTAFLVVSLYSYIYHLYSKKKSSTGVDYEDYANIALDDNVDSKSIDEMKKDEK